MKYPHFDFYPGSWTGDGNNGYLTHEQKGVHIDLLCAMWQDASDDRFGLIDDDTGIAQKLGLSVRKWRKIRSVIIDGPYAVLRSQDGLIWSERLYEEWQKALDRSAKARDSRSQRSSYERTTNDVRSSHERSTNEPRTSNDRGYERPTSYQVPGIDHQDLPGDPPLRSGSPGRSQTHDHASAGRPPPVYPPDFEQFWSQYPRKSEKPAAFKAWKARLKDGTQSDAMIAAARFYARAKEDTDKKYIKLAKTFLGPNKPFAEWVDGPPEGEGNDGSTGNRVGGHAEWDNAEFSLDDAFLHGST